MAKWGRRGWRFRGFGGSRMQLWSGRPFSKIKTVSWGSRGSSTAPRTAPKKWGTGAGSSVLKWGSQSSAGASGGRWKTKRTTSKFSSRPGGSSGGAGSVWGARPAKPRFRLRTIFLIVFLIMMVFSIQSFVYIEKNLRPPLMNIAKIRVKQMATQAINKAITEQVATRAGNDKLIDWKMNNNGKISGFMLNYAEHMSITSQTINTVQNTLNEMKGIPEHIPIGHALNSAIISSFGPRVPVKFEPVGAVKVDLSTRQKDAGINMILVEVYIRIIAEVTIIIPFDTEPEIVETDIPISYLLVVGDVPMYYYDNTGKPVGESAAQAPNISVPLGQGSSGGVSSSPQNGNGESTNEGESTEASADGSNHSNGQSNASNHAGNAATK
ncbi:sporulation protein YunB [Paenibacillus sp. FSL H8-0548]|uniref:sporulation protein YunB n=1 Tax=Paenibacillus sp. FSL H8-0548 TaxID=1920422 RepID=UPI00096FDE36|nr:sporulation protein YunB [Paenibacillus sp. FSL H8-0548]OMF38833.1 sporulation protein YunB [Paenibacillus sp. FSL H8-0548]